MFDCGPQDKIETFLRSYDAIFEAEGVADETNVIVFMTLVRFDEMYLVLVHVLHVVKHNEHNFIEAFRPPLT